MVRRCATVTSAMSVTRRTTQSTCDLSVLCNTAALEDLSAGDFDPHRPRVNQLFRWGGDPRVFRRLLELLKGGQSVLATRAAQ